MNPVIMNKIHHGDCLEIMKQIPDNYFDLVLTDVPYNVGKDYGVYKDNLSDFDYINWLGNVIFQLKRISREQIIYPSKKYFLETWSILGKEFQQLLKEKLKFRVKKFEWVPLDDYTIICDLGFCVWEINEFGDIFINSNHWHKHDTVEGVKIMVENRMREFLSGLMEVGND